MIVYYYSEREERRNLDLLDTGRELNVQKTSRTSLHVLCTLNLHFVSRGICAFVQCIQVVQHEH